MPQFNLDDNDVRCHNRLRTRRSYSAILWAPHGVHSHCARCPWMLQRWLHFPTCECVKVNCDINHGGISYVLLTMHMFVPFVHGLHSLEGNGDRRKRTCDRDGTRDRSSIVKFRPFEPLIQDTSSPMTLTEIEAATSTSGSQIRATCYFTEPATIIQHTVSTLRFGS